MLEFQGTLFRTSKDLAKAVAYQWMTAGGHNSSAQIDEMNLSAEPEVRECIENWDLTPEWLAERNLSAELLKEAFDEFLADRPDRQRECDDDQ